MTMTSKPEAGIDRSRPGIRRATVPLPGVLGRPRATNATLFSDRGQYGWRQDGQGGQGRQVGRDLSAGIVAAATEQLGQLGLIRKGRSRTWLDDHGWWLLVVEFQPSITGRFYVNVGEDHLFIRRDHLVLDDVERPLGGTWTGDDSDTALSAAMTACVETVRTRRRRHREGSAALVRLAAGGNDLEGGVAAALLGDGPTARRRLTGNLHPAYRPIATEYIDGLDRGDAQQLAQSMTAQTRSALALPPSAQLWVD